MLEAENNIIAEMLIDPSIVSDLMLSREMFTSELCGLIYEEIVKASKNGIEPDTTYLIQRIDGYSEEEVKTKINTCLLETPTTVNHKADEKAIYDEYVARTLTKTLQHTEITASNVYDVVGALSDRLSNISDGQTISKTTSDISKTYRDAYYKKRDKPLMKTGFGFLDEVVGGLEGGDMIVIGARPAVGKSAFGVQMAIQIVEMGFKVQIFNLEMTEKQVYERMISYWSGIPQLRLRTAEQYRNYEEEMMFKGAVEKLDATTNLLISTGSRSVAQIRKEVNRVKPNLVIIDYLQLLKADTSYKGNRYAEVGAISHALKAIAIDYQIPVIVLTQLNRNSEGVKEPTMAEIRESGDVEQDASIIILLWNKDSDDKTKKGCKIEKNRGGETGNMSLEFNGSKMRFEDANEFKDIDDEESPFLADEE